MNTKIFDIDGVKMQFNSRAFNKYFNSHKNIKKLKVIDLETDIGENLSVTSNAVHSWRFGVNGPADIESIYNLSDYLELSDYKLLMTEKKEVKSMSVTERQKDSLKKIYDAVIDFLDTFCLTDGFNSYWSRYEKNGVNPKFIPGIIWDDAKDEQHKVELVFDKEYLIINKLDIYEELEEYVYGELCNMYDGKLDYAYRFEAAVENIDGTRDTLTTSEEYNKAINRINELLEPYFS